ncbi:iron complex transport system ATP-binding protein [bacterium A37T11]|nr:iron complex transport system ATP-binding protein [bacterium A37T11]
MLIADNLTYAIGTYKLVNQLSFHIRTGELVVLLGANGAGKSSLLRLLSGDKKASAGSLLLAGKDIGQYSKAQLALKRSVLAQQNVVNVAFRVEDLVMMGRYPHFQNKPSAHDLEVLEAVMAHTGLDRLADRSYLTLSGGEQQRAQLARVLAQIWDVPGALLLMDEPVAGLDIQYQQQTMAIAKQLSKKGFTVVAVLHDINLAAQYGDRVIMLKNGRKWYDGTPIEVLKPRQIFEIFEIDVTTFTNPYTLKPFIIARDTLL